MIKIISVVGARPNFMKIAPIYRAFNKRKDDVLHLICHTGQHYDEKMSKVFFDDLGLPKPDFFLGIGGGSHAEQTAKILVEFEKVLITEKPDLVIVVGDVNSTIACSLAAVKLGIKVAHVEAGLRSFDKSMPEEINRVLTDRISDYLFVSEHSGLFNLRNEGYDESLIFHVGNVMIDSLIYFLERLTGEEKGELNYLKPKEYIVVTLHRPANVDNADMLGKMISLLNRISEYKKIIFPVHPRTSAKLNEYGLINFVSDNIKFIEPLGYLEFISLVKDSLIVITDSGGIQEETTYMGVPCITLRPNTERPSTVEIGTNTIAGDSFEIVEYSVNQILNGAYKRGSIPENWDGKASDRIVDILLR